MRDNKSLTQYRLHLDRLRKLDGPISKEMFVTPTVLSAVATLELLAWHA